jgi:hypothetical protein
VNCDHNPPPPLAYLRLKQMYEDRGQSLEAGYALLAGIDSHPGVFNIWQETCDVIMQMVSKSCLRVCHTAMRLSSDSAVQDLTLTKRPATGGLSSSAASGRPQEAIGIFALSDHQPDIGLFWLLRSMRAQMKLQKGSSAARPRLRTTFWALVARSRLLAWDVSIPHSEGFFAELKSFPEKEIMESVVAFHFLEAGGPPEMITWLMRLHASRYAAAAPCSSCFLFKRPQFTLCLRTSEFAPLLPSFPTTTSRILTAFALSLSAPTILQPTAQPLAWSVP